MRYLEIYKQMSVSPAIDALSAREKKTAKLLVRMTPTFKARLAKAAGTEDVMAEILIRGGERELTDMEAKRTIEMERLDKLTRLARAKGSNVDAIIEEALKQIEEPALPGMGETPSVAA